MKRVILVSSNGSQVVREVEEGQSGMVAMDGNIVYILLPGGKIKGKGYYVSWLPHVGFEKSEPKPIVLKHYFSESFNEFRPSSLTLSRLDTVERLHSCGGLDYMFVYDKDDRRIGGIYRGHWNDGVKE